MIDLLRFAVLAALGARLVAEPSQLADGLERDEHRRRGLPARDAQLHLREPVTVGRHHAHAIAVPLEERAVQRARASRRSRSRSACAR